MPQKPLELSDVLQDAIDRQADVIEGLPELSAEPTGLKIRVREYHRTRWLEVFKDYKGDLGTYEDIQNLAARYHQMAVEYWFEKGLPVIYNALADATKGYLKSHKKSSIPREM